MTIGSAVNRSDYTGSGTTGPFNVGMTVYEQDDCKLITTDLNGNDTNLVLGVDYTWTSFSTNNLGQILNGQITLTNVLATGWHLAIILSMDKLQETDIKNQDKFFAVIHESEMDQLALADMDLQGLLNGVLRIPISENPSGINLALPHAAQRAGKFLGFDLNGNAIVTAGATINYLQSSASWTPGSINSGSSTAQIFTVTGAAIGDFAMASFGIDLNSCSLSAYVSAPNTVTVVISNSTGGNRTFAAGTIICRVFKQ